MKTNNSHNQLNPHERPLGTIESFHYILNTFVSILRNVVVSIELEKSVDMNFIFYFLKSTHQNFSALRIRIHEKNNIPYFIVDVPFHAISITTIDDNDYDNKSLTKDIEEQMNTPIDSSQSMWRAKLIESFNKKWLVLTFHHSIFDGRSILKLLNHLESINNQTTERIPAAIYPPIEKMINLNKQKQKKTPSNSAKTNFTPWPIYQTCEIQNQTSKCQIIDMNSIPVIQLKKLSHKNSISINQLLNALTIKTITALCPEREDILLHTPVDLTYLSKTYNYQHDIGCFIGIIKSRTVDFKNKTLIDIANDYSNGFDGNFHEVTAKNDVDFHQLKNALIKQFKNKTTYFSGGIAISNIGEFKLKKSSIVKDIHFATTLLGGLGIFVLSILTVNDYLKLTLSYTDPLLSQHFITSFITLFKDTMDGFMKAT